MFWQILHSRTLHTLIHRVIFNTNMDRKLLNLKHGHSRGNHQESSEYKTWLSMRQRCYNLNSKYYPDYGGRGIVICERWQEFKNFYEDMGNKPSLSHTIDRFPDMNGNYEPSNCRWATKKEQSNNRRSNVIVDFRNEIKPLKQWCEDLELNYKQTHKRIKYYGWSIEKAFTEAPIPQCRIIEFNGRKQSISAWSRELGINSSTLTARLSHLSVSESFNPEKRSGRNQYSNHKLN